MKNSSVKLILLFLMILGGYFAVNQTIFLKEKIDNNETLIADTSDPDEVIDSRLTFHEGKVNITDSCDIDTKNLYLKDEVILAKYKALTDIMNNFLKRFPAQKSVAELAALETSFGLNNIRKIIVAESYVEDISNLELNMESTKFLKEAVANNDLKQIIALLESKTINFEKDYLTSSRSTNLLGILIENFETIELETLYKFKEHGLEPSLLEIFLATENNWNLDKIDYLHSISNIDVTDTIYYNGRLQSLFSVAIPTGNFENTMYWWRNNSTVLADIFEQEVYLNFISNSSKYSVAQRKKIISILLDSDMLRVNKEMLLKNNNSLSYKFTNDENEQLRDYFEIEEILNLNELKKELYDEALLNLYQLRSIYLNSDCFDTVGKQLIKYIVAREKISKKQDDNDLYSESEKAWENIERDLYLATELEEKKVAFKEHVNNSQKELIEIIEKQMNHQPTEEEQDILTLALLATSQKKWDLAFELILKIADNESDAKQFILSEALRQKPVPLNVLDSFSRGEQFPEGTLMSLVSANDFETLKYILSIGHQLETLSTGQNNGIILQTAIENGSVELVSLLLKEGVDIDQEGVHFDALDYALQTASKENNHAIEIIGLLLNHGVEVKTSHKQILSNLKDENTESFKRIIRNFPVFTN